MRLKMLSAALLAIALSLHAQAADMATPRWADMSPDRQKVLAPLAKEWDAYPPKQKQHLVALADKYPKMTPVERTRIDDRLKRWAGMSKEDRIRARANYRKVQQLPPDQRAVVKQQLKQSHANKLSAAGKGRPGTAKPAAAPAQANPLPVAAQPVVPAVPAAPAVSPTAPATPTPANP